MWLLGKNNANVFRSLFGACFFEFFFLGTVWLILSDFSFILLNDDGHDGCSFNKQFSFGPIYIFMLGFLN